VIRPVKLPDDLVEINNWMRARGQENIDLDFLPPQGFIMPKVAAGFLITTNANIAFLEHFVSNSGARRDDREYALDEIAKLLIKAAECAGFRMVMAISKHPNILRLCEKYKFTQLDTLVFGRTR
jgi:hypothetical protein